MQDLILFSLRMFAFFFARLMGSPLVTRAMSFMLVCCRSLQMSEKLEHVWVTDLDPATKSGVIAVHNVICPAAVVPNTQTLGLDRTLSNPLSVNVRNQVPQLIR